MNDTYIIYISQTSDSFYKKVMIYKYNKITSKLMNNLVVFKLLSIVELLT